MEEGSRSRRRSLQSSLRRMVAATVLLYVMLGSAIAYNWSTSREVTGSLCTLRANLEREAEQSREFLRENPEGIPGVSPKLIRDGIEDQERTIRALRGLDC